jgi:enamine deaminase RidA (YjgF/YER057c/UK114 family)
MKEAFETSELAKAGPYSHAVAVGDLVFSCGVGPHSPGTHEIPEDTSS